MVSIKHVASADPSGPSECGREHVDAGLCMSVLAFVIPFLKTSSFQWISLSSK